MSLMRVCDYCHAPIKINASDTTGGEEYFYSISRYYLDQAKGSAGTIDLHRECMAQSISEKDMWK
jgi:hypothetical protein